MATELYDSSTIMTNYNITNYIKEYSISSAVIIVKYRIQKKKKMLIFFHINLQFIIKSSNSDWTISNSYWMSVSKYDIRLNEYVQKKKKKQI